MDDISDKFLDSLSRVSEYMEKNEDGKELKDEFMDVTSEFLAQVGVMTIALLTCVDLSKNVLTLMNHLLKESASGESDKKSLANLRVRAESVVDQMKTGIVNLPPHVRKSIEMQLDRFTKILDDMIKKHKD